MTAFVGPLRAGVAARTVDLVVAWSVFSSQSVPRSELESLMEEFGAQPTVFPTGKPEPASWSVPIAGGELIVSVAAVSFSLSAPCVTAISPSAAGMVSSEVETRNRGPACQGVDREARRYD